MREGKRSFQLLVEVARRLLDLDNPDPEDDNLDDDDGE